MRVLLSRWSVLVLVTYGTAFSLLCLAQTKPLGLDEIVSRMEQARADEHGRAAGYIVTREYQLSAQGAPQPGSDVVAQVSFIPPASKDYVIVKTEGNERGTGIVRKILEHETRMAGHADTRAITRMNYAFALIGRESLDGHDCYVLQLTPLRDSVELVRGRAWVDADTFIVRRVEGTTAKSPSFWIRNLQVTVNYGNINGVWLETSTRAVADVRFVGPHVLTARDLDVRSASLSARSQSSLQTVNQRRGRRHPEANAAAWVPR